MTGPTAAEAVPTLALLGTGEYVVNAVAVERFWASLDADPSTA